MTMGRAATVWERSPPPSCIRMMEPLTVCAIMRATMVFTPGRDQSRGSTFHKTVDKPKRLAFVNTAALKAPYGGRKYVGRAPVACSIIFCVVLNCHRRLASERKGRLACDQL